MLKKKKVFFDLDKILENGNATIFDIYTKEIFEQKRKDFFDSIRSVRRKIDLPSSDYVLLIMYPNSLNNGSYYSQAVYSCVSYSDMSDKDEKNLFLEETEFYEDKENVRFMIFLKIKKNLLSGLVLSEKSEFFFINDIDWKLEIKLKVFFSNVDKKILKKEIYPRLAKSMVFGKANITIKKVIDNLNKK